LEILARKLLPDQRKVDRGHLRILDIDPDPDHVVLAGVQL